MHCKTHDPHPHAHGEGCGHVRVSHDGHEDYLHDGHLHHAHHGHVDDHVVAVTVQNPAECAPMPPEAGHSHSASCGHEQVPHGDHSDYLVDGRLHHPHDGHCDDHGLLT